MVMHVLQQSDTDRVKVDKRLVYSGAKITQSPSFFPIKSPSIIYL